MPKQRNTNSPEKNNAILYVLICIIRINNMCIIIARQVIVYCAFLCVLVRAGVRAPTRVCVRERACTHAYHSPYNYTHVVITALLSKRFGIGSMPISVEVEQVRTVC